MLFNNIEMSKFMRTWNCKTMSIWWDYYERVAGSESKQMTDESSCGWMVTKPQWLRDDVTHSRQEVEGWQCWEDSSTLSGNINNLTYDQHTDGLRKSDIGRVYLTRQEVIVPHWSKQTMLIKSVEDSWFCDTSITLWNFLLFLIEHSNWFITDTGFI